MLVVVVQLVQLLVGMPSERLGVPWGAFAFQTLHVAV